MNTSQVDMNNKLAVTDYNKEKPNQLATLIHVDVTLLGLNDHAC